MQATSLAHFTAVYILSHSHVILQPTFMYMNISPLSFPELYSDLIASPTVPTSNVVYDQYLTLWSHGGLHGIKAWISALFLLRKKFKTLALFQTWESFRKGLYSVLPQSTQFNEWFIPALMTDVDLEIARVELLPYTTYINHFNLNPFQFMDHIVQIIIFGFVVTRGNIKALRIRKQIAGYVRQRIEQGYVDYALRRGVTSTSVFDMKYSNRPSDGDQQAYLSIGKSVTPFLETRGRFSGATVPHRIQDIIQSIHSLGAVSHEVKTLAQMNAFDRLDARYLQYLRRRLPPQTLAYGYQGFMDAMVGEPRGPPAADDPNPPVMVVAAQAQQPQRGRVRRRSASDDARGKYFNSHYTPPRPQQRRRYSRPS